MVKELDSIHKMSERYWFWTGEGSLETARKKWSEALAEVFKDAGMTVTLINSAILLRSNC